MEFLFGFWIKIHFINSIESLLNNNYHIINKSNASPSSILHLITLVPLSRSLGRSLATRSGSRRYYLRNCLRSVNIDISSEINSARRRRGFAFIYIVSQLTSDVESAFWLFFYLFSFFVAQIGSFKTVQEVIRRRFSFAWAFKTIDGFLICCDWFLLMRRNCRMFCAKTKNENEKFLKTHLRKLYLKEHLKIFYTRISPSRNI